MRQQLWEWRLNIALMEGTSCLSSTRAGRHQWPHTENWRRCFQSTTTSEGGGRRPPNHFWWEWMRLQLCRKLLAHLVSLVVEPDPGDSGVAWTSEAQDLLGVTPLKHPHATILSSRQVWKTTPPTIMFYDLLHTFAFLTGVGKFPMLPPLSLPPVGNYSAQTTQDWIPLSGNTNNVATRSHKKSPAELKETFQLKTCVTSSLKRASNVLKSSRAYSKAGWGGKSSSSRCWCFSLSSVSKKQTKTIL